MNKNRNMLIMIGIVTLACGQLYGLSPRQLAKLRRFETELKERFAGRPERGQEGAWLEENRRIIGEIRRLDRPTAAEYQRRQDDFSGKIKAERERIEAEAEAAQKIAALERERQRERIEAEAEAARKIAALERERQRERIEAEAEAAQIIFALEKERAMEEDEAAQKIAALERERKQEREAARIEGEARERLAEERRRAEEEEAVEAEIPIVEAEIPAVEAEKERLAQEEREIAAEKEKAEEEIAEEEISTAAATSIHKIIENVKEIIRHTLAESPDQLPAIDFSLIPPAIENIRKMTERIQLTQEDMKNLENETIQLQTELANALFANLVRLSRPIIEQINNMKTYIGTLIVRNDFNINKNKIEDTINQIDPRLASASQQNLLLDPDFFNKADQEAKDNARQAANNITTKVRELLDEFVGYIGHLNTLSEKKEGDNKLTVADFEATAQAIQTMKWVINNLFVQLQDNFVGNDVQLIYPIKVFIKGVNNTLSNLKKTLYGIYEVEQAFNEETGESIPGQITIKYDDQRIGRRGRKEQTIADPLADIEPTFKKGRPPAPSEEQLKGEREIKEEAEEEIEVSEEERTEEERALREAIRDEQMEQMGALDF